MAAKNDPGLEKSKGVQIFIGSNTNLFRNANFSMILSNYKTKKWTYWGNWCNRSKENKLSKNSAPIVSYMSEIISKQKNNEEKWIKIILKEEEENLNNKNTEEETENSVLNEDSEKNDDESAKTPEEEIIKLNHEINELKDQRLRAIAELDNYRKRAEKDQADALKYGVSNFAKEIINIKDNIERA